MNDKNTKPSKSRKVASDVESTPRKGTSNKNTDTSSKSTRASHTLDSESELEKIPKTRTRRNLVENTKSAAAGKRDNSPGSSPRKAKKMKDGEGHLTFKSLTSE